MFLYFIILVFVAERLLEDHEYVLSASRDMRGYSRHAQFRYVFRKEYRKYEFFHNPQVSKTIIILFKDVCFCHIKFSAFTISKTVHFYYYVLICTILAIVD